MNRRLLARGERGIYPPAWFSHTERGMKLLFSDGEVFKKGGRVHLVHMDEAWFVLSNGYVCAVENIKEGLALIGELRANARRRGVLLKSTLPVVAGGQGDTEPDPADRPDRSRDA